MKIFAYVCAILCGSIFGAAFGAELANHYDADALVITGGSMIAMAIFALFLAVCADLCGREG